MLKPAIKIGPADAGRRMTQADFEHAEVQDRYLYELGTPFWRRHRCGHAVGSW